VSYRASSPVSLASLDARLVAERLSLRICWDTPVQVLVFAKFMSDSAWYFYLFWLPKYLYDVRGFDVKHVSTYAWIPYAASGWGASWADGFRARCSAGAVAGFLAEACAGPERAVYAGGDAGAACACGLGDSLVQHRIFLPAVVVGAHHDVAGRCVSPAGGGVGVGNDRIWRAIGGAIFQLVAGILLKHGFGYGTLFLMFGMFHWIGFLAILLLGAGCIR